MWMIRSKQEEKNEEEQEPLFGISNLLTGTIPLFQG